MNITKWTPFTAVASLEREMRALLDRLSSASWVEAGWQPVIDVYRTTRGLEIRAEVPGLDISKDVEVEIENGVLVVRGHKRVAKAIEEDDRFVRESRYGSFERSVILPPGVDPTQVTAHAEKGVLTIEVPLPESVDGEPGPVHIDVTVT